MVKADDPLRVDQNVTPLLGRVGDRAARESSPECLLGVGPQCARPDEVTPVCFLQSVDLIELPAIVRYDRPSDASFSDVASCSLLALERDDEHTNPKLAKRGIRLLQLQQVSSAGESAQVPVQDQQKPRSSVVIQRMLAALCIFQPKRRGRPAEPRHGG